MKFYRCKHCGNIIAYVKDSGVPIICCGEPMQEIVANTVDASREKHLPVVEQTGASVKVKVGSVDHPMTEQHYIQWIAIHTKQGNQRKELTPNSAPFACFELCGGDEIIAVYAYCNLHGLWKA
ncbi:MAG: desulfoferrodoxin family protein [Clostridia bacterium]